RRRKAPRHGARIPRARDSGADSRRDLALLAGWAAPAAGSGPPARRHRPRAQAVTELKKARAMKSTVPSRPQGERALLRAGTTPSQEEADRFYARRVADYARTVGGVFAGLYAIGVVGTLVVLPDRFVEIHTHPAKLFNLFYALLALWLGSSILRAKAP